MPTNEENLMALLKFIRSEPPFHNMGAPGIHTHPGYDESADSKYDGCLELERRGLIKRKIDEPGHVLFVPVD